MELQIAWIDLTFRAGESINISVLVDFDNEIQIDELILDADRNEEGAKIYYDQ